MRVTVQPEDPASVTGNTDKNCVCEIDRSKELRVFFFSWVLISFQICFKALFSLLAVLKQLYKGWKRFLTVYPWRFSFLQVTTGSMWKINRKKELRLCPFSHYRTPGRSWRVNITVTLVGGSSVLLWSVLRSSNWLSAVIPQCLMDWAVSCCEACWWLFYGWIPYFHMVFHILVFFNKEI